jgi:glyoxylase-like metal-dependent hydrolase (beta-lactamase superfamily II)
MLTLIPIPAFTDNYLWLLHDGQRALVVDPGDAAPVLQTLADLNLRLDTILVTHHHADHTGGVGTRIKIELVLSKCDSLRCFLLDIRGFELCDVHV